MTYYSESKDSTLDNEMTELAMELKHVAKKRIKSKTSLEEYLQQKIKSFREANFVCEEEKEMLYLDSEGDMPNDIS